MRHTVTGGAGGGAKACSGAAADERGGTEQAQAEKLTLLVADNSTGYFGVAHQPGRTKPYRAELRRGGKTVYLGSFATAEEAALCVARSPEGRAAAGRAAAAESQGTLPTTPSDAILKEEGTVPPMPPGAFVKEEGVVPLMPPGAFVKVEVVVKEEEGSDGRPKRQRAK